MQDQAADWLAAVVLTLFIGTVLYGAVAIRTLL